MPDKLSESIEDYLETILMIKRDLTVVRVKDISLRMDVSMPSVHAALHVLENQGLICHEKYGYVELTRQGCERAGRIYAAHQALVAFLHDVLGVSAPVAEQDACKIEHIISKETLGRITDFTRRASENKSGPERPAGGRDVKAAPDGLIDFTALEKGESARVVRIEGGRQVAGRLESMGIIPGARVTKKSASLMKGPIVVEKGLTQIAIGYEMARKVFVEPASQV